MDFRIVIEESAATQPVPLTGAPGSPPYPPFQPAAGAPAPGQPGQAGAQTTLSLRDLRELFAEISPAHAMPTPPVAGAPGTAGYAPLPTAAQWAAMMAPPWAAAGAGAAPRLDPEKMHDRVGLRDVFPEVFGDEEDIAAKKAPWTPSPLAYEQPTVEDLAKLLEGHEPGTGEHPLATETAERLTDALDLLRETVEAEREERVPLISDQEMQAQHGQGETVPVIDDFIQEVIDQARATAPERPPAPPPAPLEFAAPEPLELPAPPTPADSRREMQSFLDGIHDDLVAAARDAAAAPPPPPPPPQPAPAVEDTGPVVMGAPLPRPELDRPATAAGAYADAAPAAPGFALEEVLPDMPRPEDVGHPAARDAPAALDRPDVRPPEEEEAPPTEETAPDAAGRVGRDWQVGRGYWKLMEERRRQDAEDRRRREVDRQEEEERRRKVDVERQKLDAEYRQREEEWRRQGVAPPAPGEEFQAETPTVYGPEDRADTPPLEEPEGLADTYDVYDHEVHDHEGMPPAPHPPRPQRAGATAAEVYGMLPVPEGPDYGTVPIPSGPMAEPYAIDPEEFRRDREEERRKQEEEMRHREEERRKQEEEKKKEEEEYKNAPVLEEVKPASIEDFAAAAKSAGFGGTGKTLGLVGQAAKAPEAISGALAEGAGGAEMMAAAGPVGAIVALADIAAGKLAGGMDTASDAIKGLGEMAAMTAGNQYMGLFNKTVDAASDALGQVPIIGKVWASEMQLAVAPVRAFHDVVDAFVQRGKQLQDLSGELSAANAMADVRSLYADLHEAEVLGPGIAHLTDLQSEFGVEIRELLLPIKQFLVEKMAAVLEFVLDLLRGIKAGVENGRDLSIQLVTLAGAFASGNVKLLTETADKTHSLLTRIAEGVEKPERKASPDAFLKIIKSLGSTMAPSAVPDAVGAGALAAPLLGGF